MNRANPAAVERQMARGLAMICAVQDIKKALVKRWIALNDNRPFVVAHRGGFICVCRSTYALESGAWRVTTFGADMAPHGHYQRASFAECVTEECRWGIVNLESAQFMGVK